MQSLTALPDLSALTRCRCSTSVAAASHGAARPVGVTDLNAYPPDHLEPWKANGFKAWDFITDGWPLDSTVIDLSATAAPHSRSGCRGARRADAQPLLPQILTLPDLSALTSLKTLNLHGCTPHGAARPRRSRADAQPPWLQLLTALPDLSALTSLQGSTR